jgi:Flp pilus assembly protein TadG
VTRRGRTHEERGAAAVEMALILPVLILLVFGIIQFSLAYNRQQGLHAAAREGARIASLSATTSTEISDRVTDSLDGITFQSTPDIDIVPGLTQPCEGRSGQTVVVTVTADNTIDIPLFGGPTVTLTGRGEFRCE